MFYCVMIYFTHIVSILTIKIAILLCAHFNVFIIAWISETQDELVCSCRKPPFSEYSYDITNQNFNYMLATNKM